MSAAFDHHAAHLAARFDHAVRDGDASLRFVLELGSDATRIGIRLRGITAYAEPAVAIYADLGPADGADAWEALALNHYLVYGALAIAADTLFVRCVVPASIDPEALEDRVRRLAAEAAELKRNHRRPRNVGDLYSHYVE